MTMPYDWNTSREVVSDLRSKPDLTLEETSKIVNRRSGPSARNRVTWNKPKDRRYRTVDHRACYRGRGCHTTRLSATSNGSGYASLSNIGSTASRDDNSLGSWSSPPDHQLMGDRRHGECSHRSGTEDLIQSPHINVNLKCWGRHPTASSEVYETEGSKVFEPIKRADAEQHLGSESDDTMFGVRSKVGASEIQSIESGEPNKFSTEKTVIHEDVSSRQAHQKFHLASVDSLLQGLRSEKSRREACGIQHEGQNDDLECGKRVLEAWKRKSQTGFSVEINFVTKIITGQKASAGSLTEIHQVLQGIGLCRDLGTDAIEDPGKVDIDNEQLLEQIIRDLWLDLIHKAQYRRLLLVCSISHISLLDKALLRVSPSWLTSRISGLLVLDSSNWTPFCLEGKLDRELKNDNHQRKSKLQTGTNNQLHQQTTYRSCSLPLIRAVAQSTQIHILPWAKQTGLTNHSCPVVAWLPSLSNTLKAGRKERDIWCHTGEYQDCVSWSVLDMLEADNSSCLALNPNAQSSNVCGSLKSRIFPSAYLSPNNFDEKNSARASLVLNALRWVAFSFQPMHFDELFTALASKPASSIVNLNDVNHEKMILQTADDLVRLCVGLLQVTENGFVEFCDPGVKDLISQTESSLLNPCKPSKVHEMIATVCMDHLRCLHPQSLFRPWISTNTLLTEEVGCCRLKRYSTAFWPEHFRIAQADSEYLSAMLDEAIQSAITRPGACRNPIGAFQELRINLGLWICCLYDFHNLGKTYLQMGGHVKLRYPLSKNLLHIAAANASPNMLRHLLDAGVDAKSQDAGGLDTFHFGSQSTSPEIILILNNLQAVASKEDGADTHESECWCSGRVDDWPAIEFLAPARSYPDSPPSNFEGIGFDTLGSLDNASCVRHVLESSTDRSMTDNVGDSLLWREIGDGRSSTIGSPFQSGENTLLVGDIYQDDWILIDEHGSHET